MTWVYIPSCLSFPATGASASDSSSPACAAAPSATSKSTTTASGSSKHESGTDTSTTRPSGTTSRPSTDDPGLDSWISSLRASRASRTALPDNVKEQLTTAISGRTPSEWFLRFDPDMCSWRTPGLSFETGHRQHTLTRFLLTLPPSGMTRNGRLYRLPPLVPRTCVGGGGVLPTPTADQHPQNRSPSPGASRRLSLVGMAKAGHWPPVLFPTPVTTDAPDSGGPPLSQSHAKQWGGANSLGQMARQGLWPTPAAADGERGSETYVRGNPTLLGAARAGRWPTPTVNGNNNRHGLSAKSGDGLQTAAGGLLNPQWVEWLMGISIGWTSLEPLETESFQQWLRDFCEVAR